MFFVYKKNRDFLKPVKSFSACSSQIIRNCEKYALFHRYCKIAFKCIFFVFLEWEEHCY